MIEQLDRAITVHRQMQSFMLARLSAFRNDRAACRDHAAAFEQANDMLERMEWPALVSKFDQKASYIKGQRAKAAVLKSAICGAGP